MTTRASAPAGAPCWIDLSTSDVGQARAFYGAVFGWGAHEPQLEFGGYFSFTRHGARTAGCMAAMPGGGHDTWTTYLAVDDAEATLAAVTAHGGQVAVPAMTVGDLGTMAVALDPGGAAIGLWQPRSFPGFTVTGEHAAPAWFELHARDYEAALDFYTAVFGWRRVVVADDPGFRYSAVLDPEGEDRMAGIMDGAASLPEGAGAHWSVYFWVDDADAAAAAVEAAGGSVTAPPVDTPYGRLAVVADPQGAPFSLMAANEAMPATQV
ncbi:MAG TPA: VOC family protein [Acidimicrobiales bacterium]|nr:VOC family protein [Acidimicrobiales bacterium]